MSPEQALQTCPRCLEVVLPARIPGSYQRHFQAKVLPCCLSMLPHPCACTVVAEQSLDGACYPELNSAASGDRQPACSHGQLRSCSCRSSLLPLLGVVGPSAGQEDAPAAASPCLASVYRACAKLCGQSLLCFHGRGALSRYLWKK